MAFCIYLYYYFIYIHMYIHTGIYRCIYIYIYILVYKCIYKYVATIVNFFFFLYAFSWCSFNPPLVYFILWVTHFEICYYQDMLLHFTTSHVYKKILKWDFFKPRQEIKALVQDCRLSISTKMFPLNFSEMPQYNKIIRM